MAARIEALLFAAPVPLTTSQLASVLEVTPRQVEAALALWSAERAGGGLRLQRHRGELQLTTAPEYARDVEKLLSLDAWARLSRAALEVLAIVAYEQPVTRPRVDSIRGVSSESVLHTLLRYGLIEEVGRSEGPGRPVLYATTPEFLQHFGLTSLEDLPPVRPLALAEPDQEGVTQGGEERSEGG